MFEPVSPPPGTYEMSVWWISLLHYIQVISLNIIFYLNPSHTFPDSVFVSCHSMLYKFCNWQSVYKYIKNKYPSICALFSKVVSLYKVSHQNSIIFSLLPHCIWLVWWRGKEK